MEECVRKEKKWAKIAKEFTGRTQHSVKNRAISLIAKEFNLKREKAIDMVGTNDPRVTKSIIERTLDSLNIEKISFHTNSVNFEERDEFWSLKEKDEFWSPKEKENKYLEESFDDALDFLLRN